MTDVFEQDYFIPADVAINDNGSIREVDWPKVQRFQNNEDRSLLSFTGMGMPDIEYITQQGPGQTGETILDFILKPRYIQYILRRNACSRTAYRDNRLELLNLLRPNRQLTDTFNNGRLRKVWSDGVTRDIEATIQSGPEFRARNNNQWDEWAYTETLRFRCADPTWFDPELQIVNWTVAVYDGLIFGPYEDHLTLPTNFLFGSSILSGTTNVEYTGTWFAYPTIKIVGPVSSPTIRNTTLGVSITLDYTISAGETVIITTKYGEKTIVNNGNENLIGTLSDGSSLGFYLAPDPYASNGINSLEVSGSAAIAGVSSVSLSYYTRYIGI